MHNLNAVTANVSYRYDGSLAGFYCCVFDSYARKEIPAAISSDEDDNGQIPLAPERWVLINPGQALRVRDGLAIKGTLRARDLLEHVFLSCMERRETALLAFARTVFAEGSRVLERLADPLVARLLKAEKGLLGEAHLLTGFVRFTQTEAGLVSIIGPKNFVLPLIAPHFADRLGGEAFLIYDKTHGAALVHEPGKPWTVARMEPPREQPTDDETRVQALWRRFYKTIGIAERENPVCRRSHMPMRYWPYMTEMKEFYPGYNGS
ncbi:MAG: TIGR03915 family putative DNA repair protein [Oscillospiraceae bacterium]|nr:TIGR03915 family putative DNA repair protein [Oscillospiraceae bacterium]